VGISETKVKGEQKGAPSIISEVQGDSHFGKKRNLMDRKKKKFGPKESLFGGWGPQGKTILARIIRVGDLQERICKSVY